MKYDELKKKANPFILAVDFDGTLAENLHPLIGAANPGGIEWCRRLQQAGAKLILWTHRDGKELNDAIAWCAKRGLIFWAINENPRQHEWTSSPKLFAHRFIDDRNVGVPLRDRGRVDWGKVGPAALHELEAHGKERV